MVKFWNETELPALAPAPMNENIPPAGEASVASNRQPFPSMTTDWPVLSTNAGTPVYMETLYAAPAASNRTVDEVCVRAAVMANRMARVLVVALAEGDAP